MIGRESRVSLDSVDVRQRHIEFFGEDLLQADPDAGAEIYLARIKRHHALVVDGQERIDLIERDRLGCRGFVLRQRKRLGRRRERESHDQRTGPLQNIAAGRLEMQIHDSLLKQRRRA